MSIKALVGDIARHPGSFIRGMACGLDDTTEGDHDDNIAWTTGYVVGQLGPYAAIPATAYVLQGPISQYVASCL